ncbi:MAG: apolipoprotein N-acyltransferase, partial [Gemmatimonadales bacterium]
RDWQLITAGALLFVLAYPPFHLLLPSFVCLVPAVLLIERGNEAELPFRRLVVQGFWFGLLSHGLVLYWMIVALWHFTPMSALGYGATITVLAVYTGLLFAAVGWIRRTTAVPMVAVLPVFLVALEWIVGHQGEVAFPWLGLGTSLTGFPLLIQIADLVGARGITLLLVMANVVLATALTTPQRRRRVMLAGYVVAGAMVASIYGMVRVRGIELRSAGTVALIQPNVGFADKRNRTLQDSLVGQLIELSATEISRGRPDLVVWPEAAVPDFFFRHPDWLGRIAAQARQSATPVVVGGVDIDLTGEAPYDYFNAVFVLDEDGSPDAWPAYHKRYLVPIVERVPFVNPRWFDMRWFGGFAFGQEAPVYEVDMGRFGVLICYESAFEAASRRYRRAGADFIVNVTNDAWFGRTSAPYQHAAHLVMRAIENRVGIARAANSGISEFVDPLGRTSHRTALMEQATLTETLVTSDVVPLYVRWGDWVGGLSVVGVILLLGYARFNRPSG